MNKKNYFEKKLKIIAITSIVLISISGIGYVNFGKDFFTKQEEGYVSDGTYLLDDYQHSIDILNSINERYTNIEKLENTNLGLSYRNSLKKFEVYIDGKYNNDSDILYDLSFTIDGKVKFKDLETKKKDGFIYYYEGIYDNKGNLSIELDDKLYELSSGEDIKDLNNTEEYKHRNYLYYEAKNLFNFYTDIPSLMNKLSSIVKDMEESQSTNYNSAFSTEYFDFENKEYNLIIQTDKEMHNISYSKDYVIKRYTVTDIESGGEIFYNIYRN